MRDLGNFSERNTSLAVVIVTKNEEVNISACIKSCLNLFDVIVIDSESSDNTKFLAETGGARVINFKWNGIYPRKRQWAIENLVEYEWILFLDADERPDSHYLNEVLEIVNGKSYVAARSTMRYFFLGKQLRFGHKVSKVNLMRRDSCNYPNLEGESRGLGDVELHYQPVCNGKIKKMRNLLTHNDVDPFSSWLRRHVLYAELESELQLDKLKYQNTLAHRTNLGRISGFLPFKPQIFFIYSMFIKFGFLDGPRGFYYAFYYSWYYRTIRVLKRYQQ